MEALTYFEYHRGQEIEYGYGPDFVATMMWMDDYPKFYTKEEAKNYWDTKLKKELEEYEQRRREEREDQIADYYSLYEEPSCIDGAEAGGAE